jgi:hypothetical protein
MDLYEAIVAYFNYPNTLPGRNEKKSPKSLLERSIYRQSLETRTS